MHVTSYEPATFWNERYEAGYGAGQGSTGESAERKAAYVEKMLSEHAITSIIDFGCGDGGQLGYLALGEEVSYLGTDISMVAIQMCRRRFRDRRFIHRSKLRRDEYADAALSLDVIFHQVDNGAYIAHLNDLFTRAHKLVIIHATNTDGTGAAHVRHRWFTPLVKLRYPEWELIDGGQGRSFGNEQDFYTYHRG